VFLTKEQVSEMTQEQAETQLKVFTKKYPPERALDKFSNPQEIMDNLDSIANTLLYLEDHIARCQMLERVSNAGSHRWDSRNLENESK